MEKIWELKNYQTKKDDSLLNKLLMERGIKSKKEREIYLNPDFKYLSDPFLLPDMNKAAARIKQAVNKKEKILIYGDYDVDGITSTALLYRFFNSAFNFKVEYFVPDRIKDGYGLNINSLKKIKAAGIDLIITVDCGINAFKEAAYLKDNGIDLIITDHHTPGETLPPAEAVINHHLVKRENYFAADMAGVGTALKLAEALAEQSFREMKTELLPIAALGTIADMVPLKNENRIIVKNGLELIAADEILGLKILVEKLKIKRKNINAGQIAFIIAPPLNAAGRIAEAEEALKLLITENKKEAEAGAERLIKINKKRQNKEEKIYKQAENKIKNINLKNKKAIILADSRWHSGVIGIAASQLLEKYQRPVILFAVDKEKKTAKGSARSISSLNIYDALKFSGNLLIKYGGHKAAAGLTILEENINAFKKRFEIYLNKNLKREDYLKKIKIDFNLNLDYLDKDLILDLEKLSPFGIANPAPKFIFRNIKSSSCYQIGKENKHLKLHFKNGIQAVAFNFGDKVRELKNSKIDLIAQPEINRWQGRENIQLKINDYRLNSDLSTALVFADQNYRFYDFRNLDNKKNDLKSLLIQPALEKAAVYINYKKDKAFFSSIFPNHYFFGSKYSFEADFSHLIFYSLPFSLKEFYAILNNFNSQNNKIKNVIFLFNKKDINYNLKLIKHAINVETTHLKEKGLDFESSIRYNKLSERIEKFIDFKELITEENLFNLIEKRSNFKEDKNES